MRFDDTKDEVSTASHVTVVMVRTRSGTIFVSMLLVRSIIIIYNNNNIQYLYSAL